MDNTFFKDGAKIAVARQEAAGFVLPEQDFEIYSRKSDEKSRGKANNEVMLILIPLSEVLTYIFARRPSPRRVYRYGLRQAKCV